MKLHEGISKVVYGLNAHRLEIPFCIYGESKLRYP